MGALKKAFTMLVGDITSMVLFGALLAGLVSSCASPAEPGLPPSPSPTHTKTPPTASPTPGLPASATPTPSPTPAQTPTIPLLQVCSPLQGIPLTDLAASVANPYHPPLLGSDDPHQGVDLAQVQSGISLSGLPVQAALQGRAALVVRGRFPYGNALLVETPLDSLPSAWLEGLNLPSVPAIPQGRNTLTCPTPAAPVEWDPEAQSLYLLYAHLLEPPPLETGALVACGQTIGAIGSSGNALNPHLHLEARLGPSGATFPGMAHYDASANPEEMSAYCQWRVSGSFVPINPLLLLAESQP